MREDPLTALTRKVGAHDSYLEELQQSIRSGPDLRRFVRAVITALAGGLITGAGTLVVTTIRNDERISELRKDLAQHVAGPAHQGWGKSEDALRAEIRAQAIRCEQARIALEAKLDEQREDLMRRIRRVRR